MGLCLGKRSSARERKRLRKKAELERRLTEAVAVLAHEQMLDRARREQETKEFERKLDAFAYTVLKKMEEIMTAESAEPTAPVPTAAGPGDPSILSNGPEQTGSQQHQPEWAPVKPPRRNRPQKENMAAESAEPTAPVPITAGLGDPSIILSNRPEEENMAAESAEPTAPVPTAAGPEDPSILSNGSERIDSQQTALGPGLITPHLVEQAVLENMAAESAEPTAPVPTAAGPGDPSILSNGPEQTGSRQPQPKRAPVKPPKPNWAKKVPAPSGLNINGTGQDSKDNGADAEQKCADALGSSRESGPPEERKLPPSQGSVCPDLCASAVGTVCPPGTEAEEKKANGARTKHRRNKTERSDELSLDPELHPALKKSFEFLRSDNEMMKIRGLELISKLAEYQPGVLIGKREEVCLVIMEQVRDQRWWVSRVAMRTLADLFTHLKEHMDPELVCVADILLRKSVTDKYVLRQTSISALGHMIQNCSLLCCVEALLRGLSDRGERDLDRNEGVEGDSDRNAAVRLQESTAALLLKLVRFKGPQSFLVLEQEMLEHFLSAVIRLTQDASRRVRGYAKMALAILSAEQELSQILAHLQ